MARQTQHGYPYCIGEWEAKEGETRQACAKQDEAGYLFIVLDLWNGLLQPNEDRMEVWCLRNGFFMWVERLG